jgi:hypothetical protein
MARQFHIAFTRWNLGLASFPRLADGRGIGMFDVGVVTLF